MVAEKEVTKTVPKNQTMREEVGKHLGVSLSNYEYLIVSDGSGHYTDKIGGMCTMVVDRAGVIKPAMLAQSETTTTRMEFQGLLQGMELVSQDDGFFQGSRVLWVCDNKSTVECVNNDAVATGNKDLWVLYDYYSTMMDVTAIHTSRENNMLLHNLCDLHASNLRCALVAYISTNLNLEGL